MAGLYVHIPFCHSKCAYCDFYSTPSLSQSSRLLQTLMREYDLRRSEIKENFSTLYVGGGTPSIIDPAQLAQLTRHFGLGPLSEATIEANPEDVSCQSALAWREMGFDRVSMGVQSLVDAELSFIGRRHSAQQAIDAVGRLRQCGFDNLSLDLIYGIPGQTLQSWTHSVDTLMDLRPRHFSAYLLSYEPRTRLSAMLRAGKIAETDEDTVIAMYATLTDKARRAGYRHYEISNFALPGYEAVHNSQYWTGAPYLGLGPSAHSYDGDTRRINPPSINAYLRAIDEGEVPSIIDEETDDNRFNDMVITALRTAAGLDLSLVPSQRLPQLLHDARQYIAAGSLIEQSGRLYIPEDAWLISDAIISDLFQV